MADHALEALRESRIREVVVSAGAAPLRRPSRAPSCASWDAWTAWSPGRPRRGRARPGIARLAGRGGHLHRAEERGAAPRVCGQAPATRCPAADRAALPAFPGGDPRDRRRRGGGRPRNQIVRAGDGTLRAQPVDEQVETVECGLVLRSVGYRAVPLPDVPFDERRSCSPTSAAGCSRPTASRSRASTPWAGSSAARPGSWAPTSATPTRRPAVSWRTSGGRAAAPPNAGASRSTPCSPSASRTWSRSRAGARSTSRARARAQRQRPRVKLASRDELLAAASAGPAAARP